MSCNPNVITVVDPNKTDVKGFSVPKAVRVTAFGLTGKDTVTFKRVQYCSLQASYSRTGCCLFTPETAQISSAVDYQIGECPPSLTPKRNTIIIPYAGSYIPIVNGDESADLVVQVEPVEGTQFDDKEKGIDPCGCSCHDDPTEPLPMLEDSVCGGPQFVKMAWMFSPYDNKDPAATVEVKGCDNEVVGYIYPEAGPGHTIPVRSCTEDGSVVIGFAVNNSNAAAQMVAYQSDCGCAGNNEAQGGSQAGKTVIVESDMKYSDIFGDKIKD